MTDFLQGLLYPLTHLEHLAFWVALGSLAATRPQGIALPITLAIIAIAGTCLPLFNLDLPGLHIAIPLSLVGLGLLLSGKVVLQNTGLTSIGAIWAVYHGKSQASLLIDHSASTVITTLLGLFTTQLAVGLSMYLLGQCVLWQRAERSTTWFHWLGLLLIGIGLTTVQLPFSS